MTVRAAVVGLVVGGVLGGLVVLGIAAYDRELGETGVSVLFAVIVGGVDGLATAVVVSLVWMLVVSRTSATPVMARWVAAGAAATVVVGIFGGFTQSLDCSSEAAPSGQG